MGEFTKHGYEEASSRVVIKRRITRGGNIQQEIPMVQNSHNVKVAMYG